MPPELADPIADTAHSDSSPDARPIAQPLPRTLGGYDIISELGRGGMGSVYLGRRKGPGGFIKHFAIKRVHPHLASEARFVAMFLDEARIAAMIHHANVAQVFELVQADGAFLLILEYVHGVTLQELVAATGPLPPREAIAIAVAAAAGLHAAHEARDASGKPLDVVHRDVTPQNLFLTFSGDVKLSDFGVSKARGRLAHTDTGNVKGKAAYMSPEQLRGEPFDRRLDVFSLGVVLWEMLTGRRLFQGSSQTDSMMMVMRAEVPPASDYNEAVSAALEDVLRRALARDPNERFESADAFRRALIALPEADMEAADIAGVISASMPERRAEKDALLNAPVPPMETKRVHDEPVVETPPAEGAARALPTAVDARSGERPNHLWLLALPVLGLLIGGAIAMSVRDSEGDETRIAHESTSDVATEEAPPREAVSSETTSAVQTSVEVRTPSEERTAEDETARDDETEDETAREDETADDETTPEEPEARGTAPTSPMNPRTVDDDPEDAVAPSPMTGTRPRTTSTSSATQNMATAPRGEATLSLFTVPSSRVFIGGRQLGTTPFADVTIPTGRVVLRLVPDEGAAETFVLRGVADGDRIERRVVLQR